MSNHILQSTTKFLEQFSTPYNSLSDTYECKPFDKSVKAGKNTPIYSLHPYHTKVPPEGIEQYIKHYTQVGDLVLDPFCGSGMTGIAALRNNRSIILNDLSPAACHIANNYCVPVDIAEVKSVFEKILKESKEEEGWLYSTKCDCGENASIQYTIWSDVFLCNSCNSEIVLYNDAFDKESREVSEKILCPNPECQRTWRKRDLQWINSKPVITCFICPKCKRVSRATSREEMDLIVKIESENIPYWYPTIQFDESREMWRAVHRDHGITDISKFFTKRNLRALASLWNKITKVDNQQIRDRLLFGFTAICARSSKLNRLRPSGAGDPLTGTLYIGSMVREDNVFEGYETKETKIIKTQINYKDACKVITGSASRLPLSDSLIDYVFTDPPFGSNLFYADLNMIWESWLGEITNESDEAVVHVKHKNKNTLVGYKRLMFESFSEIYRVLKPNRWATVVFSNSDDNVWAAIQEAAGEAGFVIYGGKEFDKVQRSFKGTKGAKGEEKVATKDVILNLHKPRIPVIQGADLKKVDDVEAFVLKEIRETLLHMSLDLPLDERTSEALARSVTRRAITQGFSMKGLSFNYVEDVLVKFKHEFVKVDGGWYFYAARPDLQRITDDKSAIVWLSTILSKASLRFDEINLLWQQELNKTKYRSPDGLSTLLDTWFLKDDEGRYYPPNESERIEIKGHVDDQRFREAERYRFGKLDRQPSLEELFDWIDLYYTRQSWDSVVELSRALNIYDNWQAANGGKAAQMRIQLASAKQITKKQIASMNNQEKLF